MTPAGMVYNGKCATDQAQRRGVKRSAGPYTGLFYPHLSATEHGMCASDVRACDCRRKAQKTGRSSLDRRFFSLSIT